MTCTFTNIRESAQLQLKKNWENAIVGDEIDAATTGFSAPSSNASVNSIAAGGATESDTGSAVTVYVGDSGSLVGETFNQGLAANYTTS